MKSQNKWEKLFEEFLDLIEFSLLKRANYDWGMWSLVDLQGANLGNIEEDEFVSATDIIDRLDIYINDYFFDDLECELDAYNVDLGDREVPWDAEEWLALRDDVEFYNKNKEYFDGHTFEFDVLDMIAHHTQEIDLENVFYQEENE